MPSRRLVTVCFLLAGASAQSQSPAFDVAVVKSHNPPAGARVTRHLGTAWHGKLTMSYVTLAEIISYAYAANTYCISGPEWLNNHTELYDVVAKAPPETAFDDIRLMLQALLAERFKLALHREQKPVAHYELVVGKDGPRLRPAEADAEPSGVTYRPGIIAGPRFPLASLAELITRQLHTLVLDGTGLKGLFDIRLEFAPDERLLERPEGVEVGLIGHGPSIFTAVQEQLGLRLESRKTPVEMLVVDRAEKVPVEN